MEVKSISCKGVKSGIPFQKPSLYAVVSVARAGDRPDRKHNQRPEQKKTPVDRTGGENPEWDRPMQLDIDVDVDGGRGHHLLLEFAIKIDSIFGDRVVGKVRVPVSDLVVTARDGALRQVSYQVRSPDGKPNGVLTFFYKTATATAPPPAPDWGTTLYPPPPSTDVYPPPPSSTVSDLGCYPTPDPAVTYPPPAESGFGYFSKPDPVGSIPFPWSAAEYYCYPPPDMGYVYPTGGGGYYPVYPPPPPPPVNVVVYPPPPPPPPAPACCYPAPLVPNWYRPDRGLYGCN